MPFHCGAVYFVKYIVHVNEKQSLPYILLVLFPEGGHRVDASLYYTPQVWVYLVKYEGVG